MSEFNRNNNTTMLLPDVTSNTTVYHYLRNNYERVIGPLTKQVAHMYIREIDDDKWTSYLRPFSKRLWKATIIWILISSALYIFIGSLAKMALDLHGYTLFEQALTPLSAFCNQGKKK